MENKNTSVFYNGLIWGLILGFAGIIFSVILYMFDQFFNTALGYVGMAITIVILIFALRSYRDQVLGGVMPFGKAFSFAVVAVLVSGFLSAVYTYIMMGIIDPDLMSRLMDAQMDQALRRGGVSEDQLEQSMEFMSWMFNPVLMSVFGFLGSGFFGVIIALIMGAIFKRDEDPNAALAGEEAPPPETGATE